MPKPVMRVNGGAERCHSVLNGLQALQQADDWVLVHDAARPCVRQAELEKLMTELAHHPVGGLLAVPVRDTMKRADAALSGKLTFISNGIAAMLPLIVVSELGCS